MQVFIYRQPKKVNATKPLQINGSNVAFFTAPIMHTSEFLSSEDGKQWSLRFFIGSSFEQKLVVNFNPPADNERPAGRAGWYDNANNAGNDKELISGASQFLRNSETLTLAKSETLTANRTLLADRDGFAYFSFDYEQFKRIVLCQALAIAYTQVIATCMERTTKSVLNNQTDEALNLYEDILRFNAAHYFTLPVQVEHHELFAAWKILCQHYHLQILNQELTQQLSDVAALLGAKREKQRAVNEAKRIADENAQKQVLADLKAIEKQGLTERRVREDKADKRRAYLLSIAGLFLTATSLLSLFQLTPAQFSENSSQWGKLIWKSEPEKTSDSVEKVRGSK